MTLIVDNQIFDVFPKVRIGVLTVRGLNNAPLSSEMNRQLGELLISEQEDLRARIPKEDLAQYQPIQEWREIYRRFGVKPSDARSSIENLIRRVSNGKPLPRINPLVDIYNTLSLKFVLPAGGEDLDRIDGDVVLTFAGANEPAVLLLGDTKVEAPLQGEVIYKDNVSAICRRWNWREADRTKLTEETKNCLLVLEAAPSITDQYLEKGLAELKELIARFCGGTSSSEVLRAGMA